MKFLTTLLTSWACGENASRFADGNISSCTPATTLLPLCGQSIHSHHFLLGKLRFFIFPEICWSVWAWPTGLVFTVASQGRVQELQKLCSIFVPLLVFLWLLYFHLYLLPWNHAVFAFFPVLQILGDLYRPRVFLSTFWLLVFFTFMPFLFLPFFFMFLLPPFLGLFSGFTARVTTARATPTLAWWAWRTWRWRRWWRQRRRRRRWWWAGRGWRGRSTTAAFPLPFFSSSAPRSLLFILSGAGGAGHSAIRFCRHSDNRMQFIWYEYFLTTNTWIRSKLWIYYQLSPVN